MDAVMLLGPILCTLGIAAREDRACLPPPRADALLVLDTGITHDTLLPPTRHAIAGGGAALPAPAAFTGAAPDIRGFDQLDVTGLATAYRDEIHVTTPRALVARLAPGRAAAAGWGQSAPLPEPRPRASEAAVREGLEDRPPIHLRGRTALDTMVTLRIDAAQQHPTIEVSGGVAGVAWSLLAER